MKVNKDKKGGSDKASVAELSPWPSYIEVCVLDYCDLLTYCTYSNCNYKYYMCYVWW
jgi:CO dehydrogenase/acetyl-CoA synthase alpha subunit